MRPYHLEEHDSAIMDAVRNGRLTELSRVPVVRIDSFKSLDLEWLLVNDISIYFGDCKDSMPELRLGDRIAYLINLTTLVKGEHPVAIIKDAVGRTLYESPGYSMVEDRTEHHYLQKIWKFYWP